MNHTHDIQTFDRNNRERILSVIYSTDAATVGTMDTPGVGASFDIIAIRFNNRNVTRFLSRETIREIESEIESVVDRYFDDDVFARDDFDTYHDR